MVSVSLFFLPEHLRGQRGWFFIRQGWSEYPKTTEKRNGNDRDSPLLKILLGT
jgi:hypothetical protein